MSSSFTSSQGNRCSPISPGKISHLPARSPKNIFCLTLLFKLSIFARKLLKTSEFIRKYIRIPIKIGFRVQTSLFCLINIQVQNICRHLFKSQVKNQTLQCHSMFGNVAFSASGPERVLGLVFLYFQLGLNAYTTFFGCRQLIFILLLR